MTLHLRPADTLDAAPIARILSDWIDETDWMPRIHTRQENLGFGRFLIDQTSVTVAATDRALGFIAIRNKTIHALYIDAAHRRSGIGSALILMAKEAHTALDLWTFQSNLAARAFYRAHGFVEVRETDGAGNDEKLPDVYMTWTKEEQE